MTAPPSAGMRSREDPVRDTYEEYDLEGTHVAMIADPHNEHAWIQSDVTVSVTQ